MEQHSYFKEKDHIKSVSQEVEGIIKKITQGKSNEFDEKKLQDNPSYRKEFLMQCQDRFMNMDDTQTESKLLRQQFQTTMLGWPKETAVQPSRSLFTLSLCCDMFEERPYQIGETYTFLQAMISIEEDRDTVFNEYRELFIQTPGALQLFDFIKDNPQTLSLSGGKIIKNMAVNVDMKSGDIDSFRGILGMLRNRSDLHIPKGYQKNNKEDKKRWEQDRQNIIHEYHTMIQGVLDQDYSREVNNESREVKREKTFGKIIYIGATQDYSKTVKQKDGSIKYLDGEDWNGAFKNHKETMKKELKKLTGDFVDYSSRYDKDGNIIAPNFQNIIQEIQTYSQENPDEQIGFIVQQHGATDGSGGPISKEVFNTIANISPNVVSLAEMCNFGYAFDTKLQQKTDHYQNTKGENDVYNIETQGTVHGGSGKHVGHNWFGKHFAEGLAKGAGFNEALLYAKQQYNGAYSPSTRNLRYENKETGKREKQKQQLTNQEHNINDQISNTTV